MIAHGPGVAQVISLQVVRRGELIPARPVEVIVSTISPTGSCVYTLVVVEEIAWIGYGGDGLCVGAYRVKKTTLHIASKNLRPDVSFPKKAESKLTETTRGV